MHKTVDNRQEYLYNTGGREAADVVKGVSKRVIVVKSPEPKVFEEAIFIVREDYMKSAGISRSQLLEQAKQAAGVMTAKGKKRTLPPALIALVSSLLGSGAAAALIYFL